MTTARLHIQNAYMHRLTYLGISSTTLNPDYLVDHKATNTADCYLSNVLHAPVLGNFVLTIIVIRRKSIRMSIIK